MLALYYFVYSIFESPYVLEIFWLQGLNNETHVTKDFFDIFITVAKNKSLILLLFYLKFIAIVGLILPRFTRISAIVLLCIQLVFLNVSAISSPEIKYLNYLLLCISMINTHKMYFWRNTKNHYWTYNRRIFYVFGFVTLLAYSVSGYYKLLTPNWRSGEYIPYLFTEHHLLRPLFDFIPFVKIKNLLSLVGYFVVLIETTAIFFAFNIYTRFVIFILLTFMQLGILIFLDLGQISIGMLIGHIFLFDVHWLRWWDRGFFLKKP